MSSFETVLISYMCNFFLVYEGRLCLSSRKKGRREVEWRFSFNSGREGSVAAYQFALYNCFGLMESLELKSLFIQALRERSQGQFYTDTIADKKFLE